MRGTFTIKRFASAGKTLLNHPVEFRFAAKWLYSLLPGQGPINDHLPWMNFRVIEWLESYLKPEMQIFEFGSGGSTLFFSERVAHVVSAEHDEGFYQFMLKLFQHKGIANCTYRLSTPQPMSSETIPSYGCTSFTSEWPALRTMSFEAYVKMIDDFSDNSFDLVMIDGRARPSCALRALPKIKDGGWLLVDNMERPHYTIIRDLLAQYENIDFFGVVPYEVRPQYTTAWKIEIGKH